MQISDHLMYLCVELAPGSKQIRRSFSKSLIQSLVPFKIFALSVLTFIGSVAEPDKATIVADNALQRLSAGPFLARPAAFDGEVQAALNDGSCSIPCCVLFCPISRNGPYSSCQRS